MNLEVDGSLADNLRLWRYMDLAKLIALFSKNQLWLARADTFKDKHEGRFPDEMRDLIRKAYKTFPASHSAVVKDEDDFQDFLLKNSFINCWHKNSEENLAMWEIYGQDSNAVAVQTSVERLRSSVDPKTLRGFSFHLKPVLYKAASEVKGALRYEECFFRKRPHFRYEDEVRLSLDTYDKSKPTKKTPYGWDLPVDVNRLVEVVYVHPDSANWLLEVVTSIVAKYNVIAKVKRGTAGNT